MSEFSGKAATTPGQLLVADALPDDLRGRHGRLDKKELDRVLTDLAGRGPAAYRDASFKLMRAAGEAARAGGGYGFGLDHLDRPAPARFTNLLMRARLEKALRDESLDGKGRSDAVVKAVQALSDRQLKETADAAVAAGNPLALQATTGVRGNPANLATVLAGDALYADHKDRVIPVPILRSYAEGLTPAEYFCLDRDTLVRMADGTEKAIADIRPGERVLGADRTGATFPVRVVNVFDNGPRECRRYRFRVGQTTRYAEVVATPDHKVLATPGVRGRREEPPAQVPLGQIAAEQWRPVPAGKRVDDEGGSEPRAAMLGLLLGNGYLPESGSLVLTLADPELVPTAQAIAAGLGFDLRLRAGLAYILVPINPEPQHREGSRWVAGSTNAMKLWLAELGLLGRGSPDKFLPAAVDTWGVKSLAELAGALIATDGSVKVNRRGVPVVSFCSTAKDLIEPFAELLATRFGVRPGTIQVKPVSDRTHTTVVAGKVRVVRQNHPLYSFDIANINAVRRLAEVIPIPGVKGRVLAEALAAFKSRRRTADTFFFAADYGVGLRPTFDIEVDHPDHLFVLANGLVVSNSGSYGARRGVLDTKLSTASAGYLSKLLAQASHRLVVADDRDDDPAPDAPPRGLPVDTADPDNVGAFLAAPAGPYPRNTPLTPKILRELQDAGVDKLLVRSPAVGGTADGRVLPRDVGLREAGRLPGRGELVGLLAAGALGEPVAQSMLSSKHSGGVAGRGTNQGGFKALEALIQVPKAYPGGAPLAEADGTVRSVEPAPAGGFHVTVGDQTHFVPQGQQVLVKPGDSVEAGDALSDGVPSPADVVRLKGLGEGRRYFVDAYRKAMKASGAPAHRRNVELLARGLLDRVELTDETDEHAPGDVVPYQTLEASWKPRDGHKLVRPGSAAGMYLEAPVLHHTLGTRLSRRMAKELEAHGVQHVAVHPDPPPFKPVMVRAMDLLHDDPDWMTRLYGSGLERSLLDAAHRGATSDPTGTSFVPGLARAVDFGRQGAVALDPAGRVKVSWDDDAPGPDVGDIHSAPGSHLTSVDLSAPPGGTSSSAGGLAAGAAGMGLGAGAAYAGGKALQGPNLGRIGQAYNRAASPAGWLGRVNAVATVAGMPLAPLPVGPTTRPPPLVGQGPASGRVGSVMTGEGGPLGPPRPAPVHGLPAAGSSPPPPTAHGLPTAAPPPGPSATAPRGGLTRGWWAPTPAPAAGTPRGTSFLGGLIDAGGRAVRQVPGVGRTIDAAGKVVGGAGALVKKAPIIDGVVNGIGEGATLGQTMYDRGPGAAVDLARKWTEDDGDYTFGRLRAGGPVIGESTPIAEAVGAPAWAGKTLDVAARVTHNLPNPFNVVGNARKLVGGTYGMGAALADSSRMRQEARKQEPALLQREADQAATRSATRADSAERYRQALSAGHPAHVPWDDPHAPAPAPQAPVWREDAHGTRWLDDGPQKPSPWTPGQLQDHDRQLAGAAGGHVQIPAEDAPVGDASRGLGGAGTAGRPAAPAEPYYLGKPDGDPTPPEAFAGLPPYAAALVDGRRGGLDSATDLSAAFGGTGPASPSRADWSRGPVSPAVDLAGPGPAAPAAGSWLSDGVGAVAREATKALRPLAPAPVSPAVDLSGPPAPAPADWAAWDALGRSLQ